MLKICVFGLLISLGVFAWATTAPAPAQAKLVKLEYTQKDLQQINQSLLNDYQCFVSTCAHLGPNGVCELQCPQHT